LVVERIRDAVKAVFTKWAVDEIADLPPNQQARVLRRVAVLERKGWQVSVRDDDVKQLEDGIWELRVLGTGPSYRLLFFPQPGNPGHLVVLTNCSAKGLMKRRGVSAGELKRAKARRAEWLKDLNERS
jgi:putative component of toxin-antitoxin plasmid stabilization module